MRTLTDVRRDVVHTIRQVVDVVSKYAGGALPEPARTRVRGFILKLPQRWATAASAGPSGVSGNVAVPAGAGVGSAVTGAEGRKRNGRYQHHRERSASLSVPTSAKESPGSSRAASPLASARTTRSSLTGKFFSRHPNRVLIYLYASRESSPYGSADGRCGGPGCTADPDSCDGKP